MIAVIADDLTGAAEIGGIGLRYNLKVEVATEVDANTDTELLIISADTRSIPREEAVAKIKRITSELLELKPQLIYKKIDSVLRGHVIAEAEAQREVMKLDRVLIVAANPYLGRTIKDGRYFFKGEPIHLSSFSKDPEFPVTSSLVTDMLRTNDIRVIIKHDRLPEHGIAVGEVETDEDLKTWTGKVDNNVMVAGAAGFFTALLDQMKTKGQASAKHEAKLGEPLLLVCGTTFNKSRKAVKEVSEKGGPVSYMPTQMVYSTTDDYEEWVKDVVDLLEKHKKAIVAIEETSAGSNTNANHLRDKTACLVQKVLQKIKVKELVVEGGSTAASIITKQNFTRLTPVNELSAGVIRMKVEAADDLHLTMKPGSYDWAPGLWRF